MSKRAIAGLVAFALTTTTGCAGADEDAITEAVSKELSPWVQARVEERGGSPYFSPGPVELSNVSLSKAEEGDMIEGTQMYEVEGQADASLVYEPKAGFKLSAVPLRLPIRFRGSVGETNGDYTVNDLEAAGRGDAGKISMPGEADIDEAERIVSTAVSALLTYSGNDAEYAERQEEFYLTAPEFRVPPPTLKDKDDPYFAPLPGDSPPDKLFLANVLYGINSDICTDERVFRSIRPVGAFRSKDFSAYLDPGGSVDGPAQVVTVTGSVRVVVDPASRSCSAQPEMFVNARLTRGGAQGPFKIAYMWVGQPINRATSSLPDVRAVYAAAPEEAGLPGN